jgi:hypothetical protein
LIGVRDGERDPAMFETAEGDVYEVSHSQLMDCLNMESVDDYSLLDLVPLELSLTIASNGQQTVVSFLVSA